MLGAPPRQLAASREPAFAAYGARQIQVDTTYLLAAAADGRHNRTRRELAVRVIARAALLAAGAANWSRSELQLERTWA